MPKNLMIRPDLERASGQIEFRPIPLNQYARTLREELDRFRPEDLVRIYRDMAIIRGFESMLNEVKLQGKYKGIQYSHHGPAHLSIGQEAAAVGQAFLLGVEDHIYGSHRSHAEILAKGLSAIEKLDDVALLAIMEGYFEGQCLRVVESSATGAVKDLAVDYLLYGALAEIFGREAGFNKGLGGSMHAFFPPFGIYPNNAVVGGSGDIAVGAALFKHVHRKHGIVIANIGDASAACGPVWEGLCFSTMDQFKLLWDEAHRGGLPLIFNFVNNFYGMGGQPVGETMGFRVLARLGAGLNPEQMHAERVDGYNVMAVIDAIARKKAILERGDGPVLLDTVTYRFTGHSPSDASSYREKAEIEAWQQVDPLVTYAEDLIRTGIADQAQLREIVELGESLVAKAYRKATDLQTSPRADLKKVGCLLERVMFSNEKVAGPAPDIPEVLIPKQDIPRVQQLAKRSRSAFDQNGQRLP
jgi:2-oxoisovalerate dehydrogenase E1 component